MSLENSLNDLTEELRRRRSGSSYYGYAASNGSYDDEQHDDDYHDEHHDDHDDHCDDDHCDCD